MQDNYKTRNELLNELNILKEENAVLKAGIKIKKEDLNYSKIHFSNTKIPEAPEEVPVKKNDQNRILVERNKILEELISERTLQLSEANKNLKKNNEELAEEISYRRKTEDKLLQSNQKLEAIISATPDGIGMISLDGKIELIMSDKLPEMYGYSIKEKDEFVGKSAFDFIDSSYHQLLIKNIEKLLAGESGNELTEYIAIKKDSSRFFIDVNSTILFDPNGKPSSILFVERDISERKKTESIVRQQYDQLRELNNTKDKLFSIIAHDLRNPFQALLSSSELLATEIENLSHKQIIVLSSNLNNSLKNLYALLENLLNWSMMQRNMLKYKPVDIHLHEIVNSIVEISTQAAVKKNIMAVNRVNKEIFVYADADMLRSVIQNLITNAIKFTPAEGRISISSVEKDGFVEVSVDDTGIGIEKEKSLDLFNFNTFFTTNGTEGEKGTGLGLSLCREFVERNGGKIWVDSEPGKGSRFTFTIGKALK